MNNPFRSAFPAVSLILLAQNASAVVLFTDNFDVNTGSSPAALNYGIGPNHEIANPGRQGGSLATPTLGYVFSSNVQVGNTVTLAPAPGSSLGDEMLMSSAGRVRIDYNFAAVSAPIEISFNALPDFNNADQTNWFSVMIGDAADNFFVNQASVDFGILFRANGGTQSFVDGASQGAGGSGSPVGLNAWSDYKLILSDAAGTGSAFGGTTSKVEYFKNGASLGIVNLTGAGAFTANQGYIAFGVSTIGGFDSLQISSIPEPAAALMLSGSLGLMALRRRRS